MALVVVSENGWGSDELAAQLGKLLELNNGYAAELNGRLAGILASAIVEVTASGQEERLGVQRRTPHPGYDRQATPRRPA